ncbi:MAG: sugar ABC transporter ATP-binding protein [Pirellulales bacterium]|nr:sugar ABC transporter ATP-binding protein [Pirellulales bacterium]
MAPARPPPSRPLRRNRSTTTPTTGFRLVRSLEWEADRSSGVRATHYREIHAIDLRPSSLVGTAILEPSHSQPPHPPTTGAAILQARNIHKAFGGVKALVDVSLTLLPGKVHALMGENGAGKSTLMRVLAGLCPADSGEIVLDGRPIMLRSPRDAMRHGITMIHQELMPVPDLTVAENILLGREPASRLLGWIDWRAIQREARQLLGLLGVDLPLTWKMRRLSVAQMQTVEIAKALGHDVRVLIMDEPTAVLSDREAEALFGLIRVLRDRGAAVVYITHKMDEVFRIADTVTVLRDGSHVETCPAGQIDRQGLIARMVGRAVDAASARSPTPKGQTALSVRGLSRAGAFCKVSFDVRQGEVLGITGLMGAGRTELVSAVFGLAPADAGEIRVAGKVVRIHSPADAMRHGIGMVPEDRRGFGLVPKMSVKHNLTLASLADCCAGPVICHPRESAVCEAAIRTFSVKTADSRQAVDQLSGGNQQKVVIARSLLRGPAVLILDEPTRGIDVAAKAEVHGLVRQLAREGKAVVLVSSELPEVLSLADRLLVMRDGLVAAELDPSRTSQEEVLSHAMPQ